MNRENRFLKTAVNFGGLCTEQLPGIPLIEICDRNRVLIENHKGVISYDCKEILVKVRYGYICVCGENLKLSKMSKEKLVIKGNVCAVTMRGRE